MPQHRPTLRRPVPEAAIGLPPPTPFASTLRPQRPAATSQSPFASDQHAERLPGKLSPSNARACLNYGLLPRLASALLAAGKVARGALPNPRSGTPIDDAPCRPDPQDALPLRPPPAARTAGRAPAPGPALPHAHPLLRAADHARPAFHQLAAGSLRQLPRPRRGAGRDPRAQRHRRPRRRHGALQPLRLLHRGGRRQLALRLPRHARTRARPLSRAAPARAHLRRLRRRARRAGQADRRLRLRPQPQAQRRHRLPHAHGARRADAARDTGDALGLLPRFRLAAGGDAAPHRPRRPLRIGLPDPAAPG